MGWDYLKGSGSLPDIDKELSRIYTYNTQNGSHWDRYRLGDVHSPSPETYPSLVWAQVYKNDQLDAILCVLIHRRGHFWGYKAMPLEQGPFYYTVPIAWIKAYNALNPRVARPLVYQTWLDKYAEHQGKLVDYYG